MRRRSHVGNPPVPPGRRPRPVDGADRGAAPRHVVDEDGNGVAGAEIAARPLEWNEGLLNTVTNLLPNPLPLTGGNGIATVTIDGQLNFNGLPGVAEALVLGVLGLGDWGPPLPMPVTSPLPPSNTTSEQP